MANKSLYLTLFFVCSVFLVHQCNAIAVMSIDIGSEWMKVAIVSPGVPMEIALNTEFKRKTPATIAFRNGERTFGEDAQIVGVMYPQNSFSYLLDLLGKSIDNPMVQLYQKRFPYYNIISDESRRTIAFKLDQNVTYTPEELLAQIFTKAKQFAQNSAGQKVNEAVITVPGYFNQVERRALLQAAELADIRVLQLINDYTAVALNYGIFHRKNINETAHYVMFYDMGASSTTATIVGYQNVKTKEKRFPETHMQLSILGVGYDRALGGLEMQIRLQHHLAKEFDALKKTKESVFNNNRAMAKLFKEAGRLKLVLSANVDHYAQVEGLLEDHDFRVQVTRQTFEELCGDLFDRAPNVIKTALDTSGLSLDLISQVVLVGAGTRVPKVQEKLADFVKMDLAKNLNTDEAAALGAVYKAADLSQGFEVMKFVTKDSVLFPIQIVFERNAEKGPKQVKRMLFNRMNTYPQKKIITFNKHNHDFEFSVNYAELDYLPQEEINAIGCQNISVVSLTGVAEALAKHAKEGAESKGIKTHFVMDESGILNLLNVELVSEKLTVEADEEVGTLSKLGSTISKLFSGSEDKETAESDGKEDAKLAQEEPEVDKESESKTKNESQVKEEKSSNKTEKEEKEKKTTLVVLKEPIDVKETKMGSLMLDTENFGVSRQKLQNLDHFDMQKARRETALNNLEAFIIDAQQKLETDEYKVATTSEESQNILASCGEMSEWLYEDGFDATAETYEQKLADLKKLTNDLYERVFEHKERPDAMAGMVSLLNASRVFLHSMRTINVSSEMFTLVELQTLEKSINETQDFYDIVVKTVKETPLNKPVIHKVRDIANKMALLDREVQYLITKGKIWKGKQEVPSNNKPKSEEEKIKTKDNTTSESQTNGKFTEEGSSNKKTSPEETAKLPEVGEKQEDETTKKEKHTEL